jgi:hypothetical protein
MRRLSRRILIAVSVAASAIAVPTLTSAQQGDADFRQGLAARDDEKWPAVIEAMRRAIQADNRESTRRVRSRVLGVPTSGGTEYLPYYFLGEALKNQNDCGGAVAAWEISEDQKALLENTEFTANVRAGYKDCAARGVLLRADYQQQLAQTDQVYKEAYEIAQRVNKVRSSNPDLWRPEVESEYERVRAELQTAQSRFTRASLTRLAAEFAESRNATARAAALLKPLEARLSAVIGNIAVVQGQSKEALQLIMAAEEADRAIDAAKVTLTPELAASRESARQTLTRARERLGSAEKTQNVALAIEAQAVARSATDVLSKVLEAARKAIGEQLLLAVSTAEQEFSFLDTSFRRLNQLFAEKPQLVQPEMTTQRNVLQKDLIAARRRFDSARKQENIQGVQDSVRLATDARMRIDALVKMLGPLSLRDRGVVAALEDGARFYLEGQYQKALDALGPPGQLNNVLLQVHVHLFRAASLYALYLSSGQSNQSLRDQAAAEVQRCREIDPAFQPSPRAFTPRFISFYETGTATAAPNPTAPAPTQ